MTVFIETIDTKKYRWIDARFDLQNPAYGKESYEKEHVKGAIHWDLEADLSDMEATNSGRHPLPSKKSITQLVQTAGLNLDDAVIIYDDGGSPFAPRAWWLLKYAGFKNVFISLNGFEALKQQGIEATAERPQFPQSDAQLTFDESVHADQQTVKNIIDGEELGILLDARSPERFAGISEPIDPIAGRIPGAHNFDWAQLVGNHQFQTNADFSTLLNKQDPAVVYCGSGVTAAALVAMLVEKGYESIRLYPGSYSEWIADETNVVEFDQPDQEEEQTVDETDILTRLIEEGYSGEMLMKKFEYEKTLLKKDADESR